MKLNTEEAYEILYDVLYTTKNRKAIKQFENDLVTTHYLVGQLPKSVFYASEYKDRPSLMEDLADSLQCRLVEKITPDFIDIIERY